MKGEWLIVQRGGLRSAPTTPIVNRMTIMSESRLNGSSPTSEIYTTVMIAKPAMKRSIAAKTRPRVIRLLAVARAFVLVHR
jgi:hypothetical protein